jgi:hypothetical protein
MTVPFPITTFTDAEGNPLSNGYLILRISTDVVTPDDTQLCYQIAVKVPLDSNGAISGSPLFWPNDGLLPADSYYILSAYSANGQLVLGPVLVIVTGGQTETFFGTAFGSFFGS